MRGRPDLYRGQGEAMFWDTMNFFAPRPPEIGLRALLRRLVAEGRYADAYIAAIYWDACFDPGPEEADPPPAPRRPAGGSRPSRPVVVQEAPPAEDWRER